MKTLLAVTTYNQIEYTKKFISSINKVNIKDLDLVFFDDCSTDGTQSYLSNNGFNIIKRKKPMGLTYSWNLAYRMFKNNNYDTFILANNDVLVSQSALENLIAGTASNSLVCPLTTKLGAGHNWQNQAISVHYPKLKLDPTIPGNVGSIQSKLKAQIIKMKKFNGFFFAMSKDIIAAEYNNENLFNPNNTNVHQEGDLQSRMAQLPTLSLGSFIYHYKGVSFPIKGIKNGKDVRQNLNNYH